jgi:uncharacterized protein (DUF433 family)
MRPEDPALVTFAEDLRQDLLLDADVEGSELLIPEAFTRRMIDTLIETGELEEALPAYHRDRGIEIAGYGIDDEDTLNLIGCDYRGEVPPASVTRTDIATMLRRLEGMWERCRSRPYQDQLEESSDAYDMARHIHLSARHIRRIRMIVVTDGLAAVEYFEPEQRDGVEVRRSVWDIARLFRLETSGHSREPVSVDFIERYGKALPALAAGAHGADYVVYLAALPGPILADIYDDYGARLLELNVRSFLQATGKVNRGIRDTLLHEPDRFLAYNNGISATASEVELVRLPEGGSGITRIRDLQIVNGGQTTASIHRLRNRAELEEVVVQAKITVIPPERLDEVVPLISRYANSQNKVQEADLSANHPWHVELENLSRRVWAPATGDTMRQTRWFYERARGSYRDEESRQGTPPRRRAWRQTHPSRQRMTKTDVARFENLWDQLPYIVSRGAQKNFTVFMSRLQERGNPMPDTATFQRLVAKAILVRRAERIVSDQAFGGYRANIVAYAVAKLSHATAQRVDLDTIWNAQTLPQPLEQALAELAHVAYRVVVERVPGGANITEWSKREQCWTLMREEPWTVPSELEQLLVARGRATVTAGRPTAPADDALVRRTSELGGDFWLAISNWAKETDNLNPWQRRFAYTIGIQLKRGRDLSAKQALQAAKILAAARQRGYAVPDSAMTDGHTDSDEDTGDDGDEIGEPFNGTRAPDTSAGGGSNAAPRHQSRQERTTSVVDLRRGGATLQQIADLHGVTRERVRQILRQSGADISAESVREQRREDTLEEARSRVEEILEQFRSGDSYQTIAHRLGLTTGVISEVIDETATDADRADRRAMSANGAKAPRFNDEELLEAIRVVSEELGRTPSAKDYARLARGRRLPSLPTIHKRLGSWSAAVQAAGMTPNPRRRTYVRRWDAAECRRALERLIDELGRIPTYQHYEALSQQRDDLPSGPTLRNRLGPWSQVMSDLSRRLGPTGPPPDEL